MKKGQSMETITLEEALELFKLPRTLGEYEGKSVEEGCRCRYVSVRMSCTIRYMYRSRKHLTRWKLLWKRLNS